MYYYINLFLMIIPWLSLHCISYNVVPVQYQEYEYDKDT